MNFYNNIHPYYCGIDLHARILYVCIVDQEGNTCVHKEIPADPEKLKQILEPYIGNIVVGVECMHCWYWVSDFWRVNRYHSSMGVCYCRNSLGFSVLGFVTFSLVPGLNYWGGSMSIKSLNLTGA